MPGKISLRHHNQPVTLKFVAAKQSSFGKLEAPAIILNKIYHCVPKIISGAVQISTFKLNLTITMTTTGKTKLAGKDAKNCAIGCKICVAFGRIPIHTPTGTQTNEHKIIKTITFIAVKSPNNN